MMRHRDLKPGLLCLAVCIGLSMVFVPATLQAATLLFDVGIPDGTTSNINFITEGAQDVADAVDLATGLSTGVSLTVDLGSSTGFQTAFPNVDGVSFPTAPASDFFDGEMTDDSLFGNTVALGDGIFDKVIYDIAGLVPGQAYDFVFFASRNGASDVRSAQYSVSGVNSGSDELNAANNKGNIAQVLGIEATGAGELTLQIEPASTNTNGVGAFYLGAMRITTIPEPASVVLFGLGMVVMLGFRGRSGCKLTD